MGFGDTEPVDNYTFFYGNGNDNHELGTGLSVHNRIISAIKMTESVSNRMLYVHVPTEDKTNDMKDSFY
jgi:hypothetical protein